MFRRRRLVVGLALALVLALTLGGFLIVSGFLGGSAEQASSTGSGSASTPPEDEANSSPAPANTTAAPPTCDQKLVTVSAATDKPAYGPEDLPLLSLKVTNGGELPCEVNIGTSQMEFMVTSGADRIFSSKDCQAKSEDLVKIIEPGKTETANFPWPRIRSLEGCKAAAAKPGAGGAYYVFTAKLGAKTSPKAIFQLS